MNNVKQKEYLLSVKYWHLQVMAVCARMFKETKKQVYFKSLKEIAFDVQRINKELLAL